jgi:hypothetical protein
MELIEEREMVGLSRADAQQPVRADVMVSMARTKDSQQANPL